MLCAGQSMGGRELYPIWWVFLFGGNYHRKTSGWYPGVFSRTKQYLEQRSWRKSGYTWWDFVKFGGLQGPNKYFRESLKKN